MLFQVRSETHTFCWQNNEHSSRAVHPARGVRRRVSLAAELRCRKRDDRQRALPVLSARSVWSSPRSDPGTDAGPHVPALLPLQAPLYVYATRGAAEEGCVVGGFRGLCAKADLAGHDQCAAGWCTDYEGYWIAKVCTDNNFLVFFLSFCLLNWILRLL